MKVHLSAFFVLVCFLNKLVRFLIVSAYFSVIEYLSFEYFISLRFITLSSLSITRSICPPSHFVPSESINPFSFHAYILHSIPEIPSPAFICSVWCKQTCSNAYPSHAFISPVPAFFVQNFLSWPLFCFTKRMWHPPPPWEVGASSHLSASCRFSFDSTNVLSISELSPCAPRFILCFSIYYTETILMPSFLILIAAFMSRSWCAPQSGQIHCLTERFFTSSFT